VLTLSYIDGDGEPRLGFRQHAPSGSFKGSFGLLKLAEIELMARYIANADDELEEEAA
jgi:hypothetical protein